MKNPKLLLGPMRAPFLVLPPALVLLGTGVAVWWQAQQPQPAPINWGHVILVLIGSLAAHISVNALNEYFDFRSGLDFRTMKTPFSGGSGTLPAQPEMAGAALWTGLISLAVCGAIGVYFLTVQGWRLLPLGLLGLIVIVVYTTWLTRNWLLCASHQLLKRWFRSTGYAIRALSPGTLARSNALSTTAHFMISFSR